MKFQKQTYTQTPNSLFTEMKDMNECELKVVMLICRYTFGYHRDEVKLSTRRIADEIGMNTASVQKGAEAAVERGLIEKVIDGNKTTTWRAIVDDSNSDTQAIQNLTRGDSNSESLSSIKESIKKEINTLPLTIENAIASNQPVTEEMAAQAKLKDTAPKMFEKALGFSKPLPWWSNKEWTAFSEWVCNRYAESKISFGEYQIWRSDKYASGKMTNPRIRGFPAEFYDSWDMFLMSKETHKTDEERPEYKPFKSDDDDLEFVARPK
jgi:hypothetical protein